MKTATLVFVLCLLAGCVSAVKVESGQRTVGTRLVFDLDGPWNQINAPGLGAAQVWTMEGLPIDQLLVYSGIKDGEEINANTISGSNPGSGRKTFNFRASMQPDEIVSLFDNMMTNDGSRFQLVKLEPFPFGGARGFRFDYTLLRKVDGVQLSGVGFGAINNGEFFAILYLAPRLTFFSRYRARVEHMAAGVRIKG